MRKLGLAPKARELADALPVHDNWFSTIAERFNLYSGVADPTAAEIPLSQWIIYKNTTTGEVRIWVNDNGTAKKSVALT